MQTEMNRRWISLFLCCALLLGFLPGIIPSAQAAPAVTVSYYGRDQLAGLNNAAALLYAYDQIVAGVESATEKITIYNGTNAISSAELKTVMHAYLRDHVEHFWMGGSYTTTSSGGTCRSIRPTYTMTGNTLAQARTAFDNAVNQILSGLNSGMSEFQRELYLHDKLASMVTYADGSNAHNAYGAIVQGTAVCEGYAEGLQYLLQRAGIQSFIVTGKGWSPSSQQMENHAWNYVRIGGNYYHVDLTWDDQGKTLYHAYFNQTDRVILEDHTISATDYPLPSCTATDAMYFTGKDTYLDSFDTDKLGRLLKDNNLQVHVYISNATVSQFWQWAKQNISSIARKAQVSGSYSYGYKNLGKELVFYITPKNAQPTNPEASQPAATQPAATQPAATQPAPTQPAPTQPTPTQPAPTQPAPTQPAPTQPAPTQPAPTEPPVTEPSTSPSQATEPSSTAPSVTDPLPSQSPETEPPVTRSQCTEPTEDCGPAATVPAAGEEDGGLPKTLLIVLPLTVAAACAIAAPFLLRKKRN